MVYGDHRKTYRMILLEKTLQIIPRNCTNMVSKEAVGVLGK